MCSEAPLSEEGLRERRCGRVLRGAWTRGMPSSMTIRHWSAWRLNLSGSSVAWWNDMRGLSDKQ